MTLQDQVGTFCWWSLMTKDVAKANDFYQKLFDWKLDEIELPGQDKATVYVAGKGGFGNPVPLENDFPASSHWMSYITVEDVEAACQQVEKLGGKVCIPAFDIPTIGQTAVLTDPMGAAFHVFTPIAGNEDDCEMNMIGNGLGEVCWMELMVDDPSPLIPFYSEMFGWKFSDPMPMNGVEYISFGKSGENVGGILQRPPSLPTMPPVWMNYFAVTSVDDYAGKVKALGGKIVMEKMEIPGTGYFSCMEDPTGAHSYLFEWNSK